MSYAPTFAKQSRMVNAEDEDAAAIPAGDQSPGCFPATGCAVSAFDQPKLEIWLVYLYKKAGFVDNLEPCRHLRTSF